MKNLLEKDMEEYAFKSGVTDFYSKVDPQVVGESLKKIEEKYGGLKPSYIISEAKYKDHPLHECFEWSDTIAAQKWRERQASSMLRVVVVQKEYSAEPIRAFVSIRNENGYTYQNFDQVMMDPETAQMHLNDAKRELDAWMRKWKHLQQLAVYFEAIRKAKAA